MAQRSIIAVTETGQPIIVGPVQNDDSLTKLAAEVSGYGWSVQATAPVLSAAAFRASVKAHPSPIETAAAYLGEHGFEIRETGWHCPGDGVADFIAWRDGTVVVCQVRRLIPGTHGTSALDGPDRLRLRRIALHWLHAQRIAPDQIRIDCLSVTATAAGTRIQHIPAAPAKRAALRLHGPGTVNAHGKRFASGSATGLIIGYADAVMAMIDEDIAEAPRAGVKTIPAGVARFATLHKYRDANGYLLAAVPFEYPECTCDKNRNLRPDHTGDCLTQSHFEGSKWAAYMDVCDEVAHEVDRRLYERHQHDFSELAEVQDLPHADIYACICDQVRVRQHDQQASDDAMAALADLIVERADEIEGDAS
jgi:Holliday junction resolvase-like predicted endonuclease